MTTSTFEYALPCVLVLLLLKKPNNGCLLSFLSVRVDIVVLGFFLDNQDDITVDMAKIGRGVGLSRGRVLGHIIRRTKIAKFKEVTSFVDMHNSLDLNERLKAWVFTIKRRMK